MRICGLAAEGLRNERRIHETFPVKELQDYWSSRPRYEDVNPKSKEFRSGSLLSSNVVGEEDPEGGGGQTYQEWLALQREDKEEVPPPPYTLEGGESVPPQTVTNADIRSSTTTTAEVRVLQPLAPSSHGAARPAVNTSTYPAASSSHAVLSSSIPAASPPPVNMNTYPTSVAPASRQEAYSQVSAQSPQPSYPPAQGHSPGGVLHHPQSLPPSQGHSPQPYPPGVSQHPQSHLPSHSQSPQPYPPASGHQPVQSYPPHTTQHQQPYQQQNYQQPYPPTTSGQAPVWGEQSQPYPHAGSSSYQGYPPSTGAPYQGYNNSPISQSYPTSGSPVHQGYPPVDVQGPPSNYNIHNHHQSQDSVAVLANEFGRQSISNPNPSGVSSGGKLPTPPPPLHPNLPQRLPSSPLKPNSPSGVSSSAGGNLPKPPPPLHPAHPNRPPPSSSLKPSSSSNLPSRPHSQTGHHHAAAGSPSSGSGQVTSTPTTSTNRPRWPPAEWDSDTPPAVAQQFSGHRPSSHGHIGPTLTRPQTVGASSSSNVSGGSLRPTLSMNTRPNSRPDTNMPSAASYTTHGHSDDNPNPFSFPTGPAKYEQYVTFPSGPTYHSMYMSSSYPDQQGGMAYGSWPGPGRVSPPPTFPVGSMAYGAAAAAAGSSSSSSSYGSGMESQYPGGPTFPSAGGERMNFPEGPGGSYSNVSSSSYPAPWSSTSGSPMHSRK